jgi:hypothetical protein
MGTLNLTAVTPDTPYIKKIKSALEKATGQSIPLVEIKKVQRKGGVSCTYLFSICWWTRANIIRSCKCRCLQI